MLNQASNNRIFQGNNHLEFSKFNLWDLLWDSHSLCLLVSQIFMLILNLTCIHIHKVNNNHNNNLNLHNSNNSKYLKLELDQQLYSFLIKMSSKLAWFAIKWWEEMLNSLDLWCHNYLLKEICVYFLGLILTTFLWIFKGFYLSYRDVEISYKERVCWQIQEIAT